MHTFWVFLNNTFKLVSQEISGARSQGRVCHLGGKWECHIGLQEEDSQKAYYMTCIFAYKEFFLEMKNIKKISGCNAMLHHGGYSTNRDGEENDYKKEGHLNRHTIHNLYLSR